MAAALLASEQVQHYPPGKPTLMPELQKGRQPYAPQLYEFVGSYWCACLTCSTLAAAPPAQWNEYAEFLRFKSVVSNVNVVTNPPERAF